MAEVLALGSLVAARDAACVALGGLHLGPATVELLLRCRLAGMLALPALCRPAVRPHRSSVVEVGLNRAYHLTTE
jgi:hypothetical protein